MRARAPHMDRHHIRDESAHWRGCRLGPGAHGGGTAAKVSDIDVAGTLLHGEEQAAFGDAGYQGVHKRPEA